MSFGRLISDRNNARLVSGLVGYAMAVRAEEILTSGRGTLEVSRARQVAMYLAHVGMGMSLARVATAFERDRSTVAHGCHLIEDKRDDLSFNAWIECLEDGIRSLEPLRKNVA